MRINKKTNKAKYSKKWWVLMASVIVICCLGYYITTKKDVQQLENSSYYCSAENFENGIFKNGSNQFSTNCTPTSQKKYSGKYACACNGENNYGMSLKLKGLNPGDTLEVSVMHISQNANSTLVFSSNRDHYHTFPSNGVTSNVWKELKTSYIIPKGSNAIWTIYPYKTSNTGTAYYDDFRVAIKRFKKQNRDKTLKTIQLQINDQNFKKIRQKRAEAFQKGLLFSSKDDLVDANIKIDSTVYDVKVRLKGDLLDHLRGDKWSYRIMLEDGMTWNDMKIFSIHNSKSRSHIAEWMMHQLLKDEGILTPDYDFIELVINNKKVGIYAYEQHFDNQMLLKNKKVIGPIIRHNDEGYWNNIKGELKEYEWEVSAQIELFNKENEGNSDFMSLYNYGHSLLNDYLQGNRSPEEVFDMDKMAKYYALIEIGHGTHAQLLTNIRFYIDPFSTKLEPIGYDFYGESLPNINEHWRPVGQWENGDKIHERSRGGYVYLRRLFANQNFFERYMHYVEKFTSKEYLDGKYKKYKPEIIKRGNFIRKDKDYVSYKYNFKKHFEKAPFTHAKLYPLPDVSLKSYRTSNKNNVILQSFHYFPLKIVGYEAAGNQYYLDSTIILSPYSPESKADLHEINGQLKPERIIFQTLGLDSLFFHKINNTVAPGIYPLQFSNYNLLSNHPSIASFDQELIPRGKVLELSKPYLVDKGETLALPKGTEIRLTGNGSLTIRGTILSIGSPSEPITYIGTKARGQGILITNTDAKNEFIHSHFINLGMYEVGVIRRDAVVNISDSEVYFQHCSWRNNNGKIDLSLMNAEFMIDNVQFEDNSGSAIESIFSSGELNKINGTRYGGNFMDIKGGSITGDTWNLKHILSNGLVISNHAQLKLKNFQIDSSHVAIIARDHSNITINTFKSSYLKRDLEVYGNQKPVTRVIMSNFKDFTQSKVFVEEGVFCKVNGKIQKMK